MANIGQAVFVGGDVLIQCDDEWDCCQRAQAAAKVKNMNDDIKADGPLQLAGNVTELEGAKANAQARAWRKFRGAMEKAQPHEREAVASQHATAPCQGKDLADKWNQGKTSSKDLGVEMDHPLEVKWGGAANVDTLLAVDKTVNNFFGVNVCQVQGDKMLAENQTEVTSVELICPKSSPGCPNEDHNAAP